LTKATLNHLSVAAKHKTQCNPNLITQYSATNITQNQPSNILNRT